VAGACAAGPYLFVPTDDGIVRVEVDHGALVQTRVFAETAPLVCAADRLATCDGGLLVERARDVIRLQLT
jgi:H/ACA ribonucleoprotein complex subunit 3